MHSKRARKLQKHGRHNNMENTTKGVNAEKICDLANSFYYNVNQR